MDEETPPSELAEAGPSIAGLETLPTHSADLLTVLDVDGTIRYESPAIETLYGYEQTALIGEPVAEYIHPDDRERVMDAFQTLQAATDHQIKNVEYRHRVADDDYLWVESVGSSTPTPEGQYVINSRDISTRKARDHRFRALAEEYRTLLSTVDDGLFFVDVDAAGSEYAFQFSRINDAFEEITGIPAGEIRGRSPRAIFGAELGGKMAENYRECAEERTSLQYQEEVPVDTGARYWQTSLTPVVTGGEVSEIIGVTRNITERVTRERQLRSQKEQLDAFAGVVAHDIRNPLGVAQGRLDLLADETDSEHLPPISRALDRIDDLVSETLTLARQGQVVAEPAPIDLDAVVSTCWATVSTADADLNCDTGLTVMGDRSRLQHIFENLFRNAIEHGGSDVTVRVGRCAPNTFYVENTGPPIPADDRESVFEAGHTSTREGTGFGLAIVKRIAEAHGWEVTVTEGTDGGARFVFTDVDLREEA